MLKFVSHLDTEAGLGDWTGKALTHKATVTWWQAGLPVNRRYELDSASDLAGVPDALLSSRIHADSMCHHGGQGSGRVQPPSRSGRTQPRLKFLLSACGGAWLARVGPPAALIAAACTILLLLFCSYQAATFTEAPLASLDPSTVASFFMVMGPWVLLGSYSISLF
jgi:hypothetical protein